MSRLSTLRKLVSERRGNITMILAGALVMLAGSAAFAVDTGSLYLEQRRLQGVADAAAMAAANSSSADAAAQSTIAANGVPGTSVERVEYGNYSPDSTVAPADRFVVSGSGGNAVRLTLGRDVPLFFGRFLIGRPTARVSVKAMAARVNLASFSIGSRLASVSGGLPGQLLSGLAGTELNLSVMDSQALVSANADILAFSDALRTTANLQGLTFGETLASTITLPQALNALAGATTSSGAQSALRALALRVPPTTVQLSKLIDLGPLAGETRVDPTRPINADTYSLLREMLATATGKRQLDLDLQAGVPGILTTRVKLAIGERPANSPWLAVAQDGTVKVRTAQTRLYVDATVGGSGLLGIVSVHLPLFVELASAEASLSDISCPTPAQATVGLNVTTGAGQAAIGDIDTTALGNFGTAITPKRTTLVKLLLAEVTGQANVALGGISTQRVSFSAQDIAQGKVRTVATRDLTQGIAASLITNLDLTVLGINLSLLTATVGTILQGVAAPIDSLLNSLTTLLGVGLGEADLRVNGVRCGKPVLVG